MSTFTDKATLATTNSFVNQVRCAMIYYAFYTMQSSSPQTVKTLDKLAAIVNNAGADAPNMAWRVAAGTSTVASNAPTLPSDADVQSAVNTIIDSM